MKNKDNQIEAIEVNETITLPSKIITRVELMNSIVQCKSSEDMDDPVEALDNLKKQYEIYDKKFKEFISKQKSKLTFVKNDIKAIEEQVKGKALELVQVEKKTIKNRDTGEIKFKTIHNLNTKWFSYTPPKKGAKVDYDAIVADPLKYAKFVKEVISYEIDAEAIANAQSEELPWKESNTEAKIALKKGR